MADALGALLHVFDYTFAQFEAETGKTRPATPLHMANTALLQCERDGMRSLERDIVATRPDVNAVLEAGSNAHAQDIDIDNIGTIEDDETDNAIETIRALYTALRALDPDCKYLRFVPTIGPRADSASWQVLSPARNE